MSKAELIVKFYNEALNAEITAEESDVFEKLIYYQCIMCKQFEDPDWDFSCAYLFYDGSELIYKHNYSDDESTCACYLPEKDIVWD